MCESCGKEHSCGLFRVLKRLETMAVYYSTRVYVTYREGSPEGRGLRLKRNMTRYIAYPVRVCTLRVDVLCFVPVFFVEFFAPSLRGLVFSSQLLSCPFP